MPAFDEKGALLWRQDFRLQSSRRKTTRLMIIRWPPRLFAHIILTMSHQAVCIHPLFEIKLQTWSCQGKIQFHLELRIHLGFLSNWSMNIIWCKKFTFVSFLDGVLSYCHSSQRFSSNCNQSYWRFIRHCCLKKSLELSNKKWLELSTTIVGNWAIGEA